MWLPDGELGSLVKFVEGVGISKALLQALLLRIAKGDNAAAAVKSIEMLLSMDLTNDLTIGTTTENAAAIAELASRFLNDTDLDSVLSGVFASIGTGENAGDDVSRTAELQGVRKVDRPGIRVFVSQSSDDGFYGSDDSGRDSQGDRGNTTATFQNGDY